MWDGMLGSTRLVLLLPSTSTARPGPSKAAMRKAIAKLHDELRRSITWDQGAADVDPRQLHDRDRDPDLLL